MRLVREYEHIGCPKYCEKTIIYLCELNFYPPQNNLQIMTHEILKHELSQQINEFQMKGWPLHDTIKLLITNYDAQLCEKGFDRNVKKIFRIKRNLLRNYLLSKVKLPN